MSRRGRGSVVLGCLLASAALLGVATRTWVEAGVPQGVPGAGAVPVPGGTAAAVVPALGLVALAAAGALTIAGRRVRVVVLALTALAGAGAAAGAARVLVDPAGAARSALGEATGLAPGSVGDLGATTSATAWPVVAVLLGAALVTLSLAGLLFGRRWDTTTRFEQPGGAAEVPEEQADVDPHDGWDALSRGDDPTRG